MRMTEELLLVIVYILAGDYPLMNHVWMPAVHCARPVASILSSVSS